MSREPESREVLAASRTDYGRFSSVFIDFCKTLKSRAAH